MATSPTQANGKPKAKSTVKRQNKPRTFFMAYKGDLQGEPEFVFDRDALVDRMLDDRDLKVKRITVPVAKRAKTEVPAENTANPTA